jgi:hypothetical protein
MVTQGLAGPGLALRRTLTAVPISSASISAMPATRPGSGRRPSSRRRPAAPASCPRPGPSRRRRRHARWRPPAWPALTSRSRDGPAMPEPKPITANSTSTGAATSAPAPAPAPPARDTESRGSPPHAALRVAHQVPAQHHAGNGCHHVHRQADRHLGRRHVVQLGRRSRRKALHAAQRQCIDHEEDEAGPHRRQAQEAEADVASGAGRRGLAPRAPPDAPDAATPAQHRQPPPRRHAGQRPTPGSGGRGDADHEHRRQRPAHVAADAMRRIGMAQPCALTRALRIEKSTGWNTQLPSPARAMKATSPGSRGWPPGPAPPAPMSARPPYSTRCGAEAVDDEARGGLAGEGDHEEHRHQQAPSWVLDRPKAAPIQGTAAARSAGRSATCHARR